MAGLGSLVVELSANIAKFESAMSRANYVAQQNTRQITGSINSMKGSLDAIPGSILRIAAAAGGLYAIGSIFKSAINAADEFKMSIIGIAAGITNIAKPGQGTPEEVFKKSMAYAKEMNKELMRVAAVSPAEPEDMMRAYNQLVQQGYVARLDEADALGVIVSQLRLVTTGQALNKQINQEIRAIMSGQAKEESMMAMELKTKLGPGWAQIVQSHKQSGDLLQWWASLYPGVTAASAAYQATLTAQKTSLIGNLKYLSYEGMGGAYDYIVAKAQELNTWIQNNGAALTANMGVAWQNLKPSIEAVVAAIVSFVKFMGSAAMKMTEVIARTTEWLKENGSLVVSILELYAISKVTTMITAMAGAMALAITNITQVVAKLGVLRAIVAGPWSPITIVVTVVGLAAALTGLRKLIQAKLEAAGVINPNEAERAVTSGPRDQVLSAAGSKIMSSQGRAAFVAQAQEFQKNLAKTIKNTKPPEVQIPGTGGKGGGGKGGGADSIQKEMEKLAKETDKARKDAIDAENDAFNMVWKLKQDTAAMYAEATSNQYEIKGLYQSSYETLGSISPIMEIQIGYQKRALDLQMEIEKYTLETKIDQLGINKAQADELRGLQALTSQAKKFNAEMESDKGIRGWAYGRAKEASQRKPVQNLLGGAESLMGETLGTQIVAGITGKKEELKNLFKDIFSQAMAWVYKTNAQSIMDFGAKLITPKQDKLASKIAKQDLSNLKTETRNLRTETRTYRDFGKTTDEFGMYINKGVSSWDEMKAGFANTMPKLDTASLGLQSTVPPTLGAAQQSSAASVASTLASTASVGAAIGMGISALGLLTGSEFLMKAGMVISTAAAILQTAAIILMSSSWSPFHGGGLVAHGGLLVAHGGLNTDERLVKVLTGEGILQRSAMAAYGRMGIGFDDLNNGRLPAVPVPMRVGGGSGGGPLVHAPISITINPRHEMTQADYDRHARMIKKSLNKHIGTRGQGIGDGRS